MGDPETNRRLSALESGFLKLQEADSKLVESINHLSTDMQLMAQSMSVLAEQLTTSLRQNEQYNSDRLEGARLEAVRESRFSKIEIQLKIVSFIGGAVSVSLIGAIVKLALDS